MGRRAFVTGASGFLGLNLIGELLQDGWEVTALRRPTSNRKFLERFDVRQEVGHLEDAASLLKALPASIDAVFHTAASVSWWKPRSDEQYQTNVIGTRNMVCAAIEKGVRRFIHTSSFLAFWPTECPISENSVSGAASSSLGYVRTKCLAEQEVRKGIKKGLDCILLNPAHIIGPYDIHNWGRSLRMVARDKLPGIPSGSGPFCHSQEVARAHITAVDRGRCGENYLLTCTNVSYLQLFSTMGRVLGKKIPKRALPNLLIKAVGTVLDLSGYVTRREPDVTRELATVLCQNMSCSSDKSVRELGYRPRSLEEMLCASRDWLAQEGFL